MMFDHRTGAPLTDPDGNPVTTEPPHFGFEDPEPELEFYVMPFDFSPGQPDIDGYWSNAEQITRKLNDGWQIDDKIICPPFVMIIFSREKETQDNDQ